MYYIKVKKGRECKIHCPSDWNKLKFTKGEIIQLYENKKLIGNCAIREGWITYLVIHPDYRRKGLGEALLKKAEKQIGKKYNKSFLIPMDNDEGLIEFYSRNGYVHSITKDNPLYEEEDKDCWVMFKRFNYGY